jgi:hypothetical protein
VNFIPDDSHFSFQLFNPLAFFTNSNTAARTYTFPNKDGTIACLDDITAADVAGDTHAAASKTTPADLDEIPLVDSAASWALKKLTWANLKAAVPGRELQSLYQSSGASDSTSSDIPVDDTIPQNTEGKEIFTQAITPTNASNIIRIEWSLNLSQGDAGGYKMASALFKDSTADALCAIVESQDDNGISRVVMQGYYQESAGSTSSRTYKIRYGGNNTTYLNGQGGRQYGGVNLSWMRVSEVAA